MHILPDLPTERAQPVSNMDMENSSEAKRPPLAEILPPLIVSLP